jgi:hypothetical protein
MKSTKVQAGRFTVKGSTAQLTRAASAVVCRPILPPTSYVDPDNFQGAVQVLYRARAQLLNAADQADFASRKAGTPIRTQAVRANIDLLCAEISRIEQQVMLAASAEFGQGSAGVKDLLRRVAGLGKGRQVDLELDEEGGTEISLRKQANDRRKVGELSDRFGHQSLVRTLRDNARKTKGFDQKGLDLAFTALGSVAAKNKKSPSAPASTKPKSPPTLPTGKDARELVLATSPAELSKRFSADELAKLLADITSLGSFSITETDLRAVATLLAALKIEGIKPSDAARILDAFGADNMETLLSNIRSRMLLDQSYFSPQDRELLRKVLVDFSLLVRQALEAPGYYESEHALHVFLQKNPITVSILLLEPSDPPPSSKLLALLAGRILVDPGALQILNVNYAPGRTARMLLLDALEKDQKAGGDAVERYLFDHLNVSPWPADDVRQNALLISHTRNSVGDVRGDENDERTADMFLAAVIARFQTNKHDVLTLFKTAVEGKFSDHGARYSEEGQFTMAHILSMLMNEQSMLRQGTDKPSSFAVHFENLILGGGRYDLQGIDLSNFKEFVGSIGQSRMGGAEIMVGLNSYLASKGGASLLADPVRPASVIGILIDAIRDKTQELNGDNNAMVEFLLGAVMVAGAAAFAPEALAAAAAAGIVMSEVQKRATIEVSKTIARQVSKIAAQGLASSTQDVQSLRGDLQVMYSLNIFSTLPKQMQTDMLNDPKIKPFVIGGRIVPPIVGSMAQFETGRRLVAEPDKQAFASRVTYYIPPSSASVLAFSNAFFLQFGG